MFTYATIMYSESEFDCDAGDCGFVGKIFEIYMKNVRWENCHMTPVRRFISFVGLSANSQN